MPRANKAAVGNRNDLLATPLPGIPQQGQQNGQPTQPIQTPTGMAYGEAGTLTADQQAQPLPAPAAPAGPPPGQIDASTAAKNFQMPPGMSLIRKSERPNEPVHAGLPGSPVDPGQPGRQVGSLSSMLAAVAAASSSPALNQLAQRAAAAGQ